MNPRASWALAVWHRSLRIIGRVGRDLGQWSAAQSWWRLSILAILALVAQAIVNDHFLQAGGKSSKTVTRTHKPGTKIVKETDKSDEEADIRINENGITVTHHHAKPPVPAPPATPPASTNPSGTDGHPGTTPPNPGSGAPAVTAAAPASGAAQAPGTVTATAPVPAADPAAASGSDTPSAGLTILADSKDAGSKDGDGDASSDDEDTSIIEMNEGNVRHWFGSMLEGSVLLLIVYLIAAKIVVRQTAKSDARAVQAEQNAASAAAVAEREALQRQLAQAQLQALQAQVEPHFLFNTLASVDYLIETDPARASAMQKNLIQYLRAALPQMRGSSSQLGREADLARAYLEILKVRMEDRLQVSVDIPDGLRSAEFPPMMLQSLVENAIQHGVEPKPEGGEVRVSARVADGHLEVAVADTGVGLTQGKATAGGGVGLGNVRERLARLYGSDGQFTLTGRVPSGAIATVRLPYRVGGKDTVEPGSPQDAAPPTPGSGPAADDAAFRPSFKAQ